MRRQYQSASGVAWRGGASASLAALAAVAAWRICHGGDGGVWHRLMAASGVAYLAA